MAATKLQMNWTNVTHASIPIIRVTSVMIDQGGELIEFSGDNDRFPVVVVNAVSRPKATITSGDAATLLGIAVGTDGTLTARHLDIKGASGGAIDYTLLNAVKESSGDTGPWGQRSASRYSRALSAS